MRERSARFGMRFGMRLGCGRGFDRDSAGDSDAGPGDPLLNATITQYGGYSSVAERRSVAPDVEGSKPSSRPNFPPRVARRLCCGLRLAPRIQALAVCILWSAACYTQALWLPGRQFRLSAASAQVPPGGPAGVGSLATVRQMPGRSNFSSSSMRRLRMGLSGRSLP